MKTAMALRHVAFEDIGNYELRSSRRGTTSATATSAWPSGTRTVCSRRRCLSFWGAAAEIATAGIDPRRLGADAKMHAERLQWSGGAMLREWARRYRRRVGYRAVAQAGITLTASSW